MLFIIKLLSTSDFVWRHHKVLEGDMEIIIVL